MFESSGGSRYRVQFVAERGAQPGVIRRLGSLAEISGGKPGDFWSGSDDAISPARRMHDNPTLKALTARKTDPEHLEGFFAPTTEKAPVGCPDGRPSRDSYNRQQRGEPIGDRNLGPKIFGGSPGAALIERLVGDRDMSGDANFIDDINGALKRLGKNGIHFGGHTDDASHTHPENSGCAAIDNIPDILGLLGSSKSAKHVKRLVDRFDPHPDNDEHVRKVVTAAKDLGARADTYFQRGQDGTWGYKKSVLRALHDQARQHEGHDPVHELVGPHQEQGLIINNVPGGTMNRGRFNADTGGKVQMFNYDFWLKKKMAKDLYPGNEHRQRSFLTASLAFAMGVLGLKTDGSLDVYMREPK